MKIRIRRVLLTSVMMAVALCAIGSASARWPKIGVEWAEWTRYDSNGDAIGGGRIECDGSIHTWGQSGPAAGPMTLYPC